MIPWMRPMWRMKPIFRIKKHWGKAPFSVLTRCPSHVRSPEWTAVDPISKAHVNMGFLSSWPDHTVKAPPVWSLWCALKSAGWDGAVQEEALVLQLEVNQMQAAQPTPVQCLCVLTPPAQRAAWVEMNCPHPSACCWVLHVVQKIRPQC